MGVGGENEVGNMESLCEPLTVSAGAEANCLSPCRCFCRSAAQAKHLHESEPRCVMGLRFR